MSASEMALAIFGCRKALEELSTLQAQLALSKETANIARNHMRDVYTGWSSDSTGDMLAAAGEIDHLLSQAWRATVSLKNSVDATLARLAPRA